MDVDEWVAGFELLLPARKAARQEREEHARQWAESQRRRALVRERNKRESLRITTLDELLAVSDRAAKLRAWLASGRRTQAMPICPGRSTGHRRGCAK